MRFVHLVAAALVVWSAAAAAEPKPTLIVGNQRGTYHAVMEAAGELKDVSYEIEWHEFPAAAPLVEAMQAGAIDAGQVGDGPLSFALAAGAPVRAIVAERSDPFGTAILAGPKASFDGITALKGHRIATGKGTIGHLVVLAALAKAGLSPGDVDLQFLAPVDAKVALLSGSVDAWATWDPYTAAAETDGTAHVIVNGRGYWSGLSYLVASPEAIAGKRAALEDFAQRLKRAQAWANGHPDLYAETEAKLVSITAEAAKLALTRRQSQWMPIDNDIVAAQQRDIDLYATAHVIPKSFDAASGFDRSFMHG